MYLLLESSDPLYHALFFIQPFRLHSGWEPVWSQKRFRRTVPERYRASLLSPWYHNYLSPSPSIIFVIQTSRFIFPPIPISSLLNSHCTETSELQQLPWSACNPRWLESDVSVAAQGVMGVGEARTSSSMGPLDYCLLSTVKLQELARFTRAGNVALHSCVAYTNLLSSCHFNLLLINFAWSRQEPSVSLVLGSSDFGERLDLSGGREPYIPRPE